MTIDLLLSLVLRWGLLLAISVVLLGAAYFLWHHGNEPLDPRVFIGQPNNLSSFKNIFTDIFFDHGLGILQLGIVLVIATPVTRVASCLAIFIFQRDYLYVAISGVVLMALFYSLFWSEIPSEGKSEARSQKSVVRSQKKR